MRLARLARLAAALALAGVLGASSARASVDGHAPEGSGLPPATAAKIDALLQREIDAGEAPGISIAIARGDDLLYARGYGRRDLTLDAPAGARTVYAIGSVTKQFTATAILLLQEEHRLSIDDRLSTYVPELHGASEITLRELLQQRSGVPNYTRIPGLDLAKGMTWSAFIDAVNRLPAEFAPGAAFRYDNLNYLLLGVVVERASGMPYEQFVRTRIIDPLHLDATGFVDDARPRAVGYTRAGKTFRHATPWSVTLLGGAGSMTSSAVDLVRWDAALQAGRVVSVDDRRLEESPGSDTGYAMGWVDERDGGVRLLWHNGEIAGYHAMNAMLPAWHLAVVVLTNVDGIHGAAAQPERLARRVLGILEPDSPFGEDATAQQHAVPADPALAARVRAWIAQFEAGKIDRSQLTPRLDATLTPDVVARTAESWAPLGTPQEIEVLGHERRSGFDSYVLRIVFEHAPFIWKIAVTRDGKLAGAGGMVPAE
ncbi:MAG TPA: serine hydrolase domain-containing protein [Candidatus Dormibacteraeota bacterium]|nr:serine hydrolase domain-containing protein [Candidatus Dormibacteraeota bacterium]